MKTTYFLDGQIVDESKILISMKNVKSVHQELYDVSDPNNKKLIRETHEEHYETKEYSEKQAENARKYFQHLQDMHDDMELKYG